MVKKNWLFLNCFSYGMDHILRRLPGTPFLRRLLAERNEVVGCLAVSWEYQRLRLDEHLLMLIFLSCRSTRRRPARACWICHSCPHKRGDPLPRLPKAYFRFVHTSWVFFFFNAKTSLAALLSGKFYQKALRFLWKQWKPEKCPQRTLLEIK